MLNSLGVLASYKPTYAPVALFAVFVVSVIIFIYGLWREIVKAEIYRQRTIPLPIFINIGNRANNNGEGAIAALFNVIEQEGTFRNHESNLNKYFNILKKDLIFEYSSGIFQTEQLKYFINFIGHDLRQLRSRVSTNVTLYLAYAGPTSVAIAIGNMLATSQVKIFHYDRHGNSGGSYYPVIQIEQRNILVNSYTKFAINPPIPVASPAKKVTLAINASPAPAISIHDPAIVSYGDVIHMTNISNSEISLEDDWLLYCQEIYTKLMEVQGQYREIKLAYAMPVGLGIALGMLIVRGWPILLTHYDNGTYKDLIKLNEIPHYF